MSLADELLADLEDDNDVDDDLAGMETAADEVPEDIEQFLKPTPNLMDVDVQVHSIRELCKLRDSERLQNILKQIEMYSQRQRTSSEMLGNVESDPEYRLIVDANALAVDVDNEICMYERCMSIGSILIYSCFILAIIHKFAKEKYQKRFPELESLILGEIEYLLAVKELGNDLDQVKNNEKLQAILTQATIMIVSVTASTTQG